MSADQDHARAGAAHLRKLMLQAGLTAPDVAERARVSASSVRAWKAAQYVPSDGAAFQVASLFPLRDGVALLEAWGLEEAAAALRNHKDEEGPGADAMVDVSPPDTEGHLMVASPEGMALAAAFQAWVASIERRLGNK